ncbi:hypothetical protein LINGRAHAP2_LOCUS6318 [Linum grandiflorum]
MKATVNTKSSKLTRFLQGVNIRSLMGQRLSRSSIGSLVSMAIVSSSTEESSIKELVAVRGGSSGTGFGNSRPVCRIIKYILGIPDTGTDIKHRV